MLTGLLPGAAEAAVFATAVFVLNATPGVDFLLTVSRTLQGGVRAGVMAALGINAGCVVHALAAAFGLAALMALHPKALTAVQWVGAGYLAWLGGMMLRRVRGEATVHPVEPPTPARSAWADFRTGLLTNVLNPKVALFFLAFLPQFVPGTSPDANASFLLLGAWFVVQSMLFLLVLVMMVARLRRLQASPRVRRALQKAGGMLFIGLALKLVAGRPAIG